MAFVIGAYAGDTIGFVPLTMFWVDYLARGLGLGIAAANVQWALFALGAMLGPLIMRTVVPRAGWQASLTVGLVMKSAAVGVPFIAISLWSRSVSPIVVGALVPGIVALTSRRLAEIAGPAEHKCSWAQATEAFALAQAVAGYGLSGFSALINSYRPSFAICAVILPLPFIPAWLGDPARLERNKPPQTVASRRGLDRP